MNLEETDISAAGHYPNVVEDGEKLPEFCSPCLNEYFIAYLDLCFLSFHICIV